MRALTWLVGVLVILLGLFQGPPGSSIRTAVWLGAAVLWFFLGVGLGVVFLAKVVTGKMGAGLNAASFKRPQEVPAPQVKHGS